VPSFKNDVAGEYKTAGPSVFEGLVRMNSLTFST
jgi:hypothetical protein